MAEHAAPALLMELFTVPLTVNSGESACHAAAAAAAAAAADVQCTMATGHMV
jgi:hypothetical protein